MQLITHSVSAVSAAQAGVCGTTHRKLAERAVQQILLAVQARRPASCFPTRLTFRHELHAVVRRGGRNRKIFQHLRALRQQTVAVQDVGVGFLQAVEEVPIVVAEQAAMDFVDPIIVERVAPRVRASLSFQMLRQQPRVVFHSGLRVGVHRRHRVVRTRALL